MNDRRPEQLLAYFSDDFGDDDVGAVGEFLIENLVTATSTAMTPVRARRTSSSTPTIRNGRSQS